MSSEQDLLEKCKNYEDRINNLKITIKQLGNDNANKEAELGKLKKDIESYKEKELGLSLQLDRANEQLEKLRKTKSVRVYDADKVEEVVNNLSKHVQALEQGIKNQELSYSRTDIGKITKQLNTQLDLNAEQQQQIISLNESINEQYIAAEKREALISKQNLELNQQSIDISNANNRIEELKLFEYQLKQREDKVKDLTDQLDTQTKLTQITKHKYIAITLVAVAIMIIETIILLF